MILNKLFKTTRQLWQNLDLKLCLLSIKASNHKHFDCNYRYYNNDWIVDGGDSPDEHLEGLENETDETDEDEDDLNDDEVDDLFKVPKVPKIKRNKKKSYLFVSHHFD